MQQIDIGFHRLLYARTGPGAFHYTIEYRGFAYDGIVAPRRIAAGEVTGLRGKSGVIRAHLTRIGREAIGERGVLLLRPGHLLACVTGADVTRTTTRLKLKTVDGTPLELTAAAAARRSRREDGLVIPPAEVVRRFRQRRTADRPARAFGEDASNRSEIKRRSNRTKASRPSASSRAWSRRKADRP